MPATPVSESIPRVLEALRAGHLVAFRTDTLYGVSAAPEQPAAMARLRALKAREGEGAFVSLAADAESALAAAAVLPERVRALADRCWPGPATLVLPAGAAVPAALRAADGSWAVRVPADAFCRALAREWGSPLPSTSANRAGRAAARTAAEVVAVLGADLELVVDGGEVAPGTAASALLDARVWPPRLLRGALPQLEEWLRNL
ncbi:MAG TPA: Sua5/YciO/YrdC/YwlC family protein [Candidatus Saccharimonadales bacterium]|nr:Sua5/YciO/YrdC/YwlC family protein [Candidatus Saccharimonadales bacterium]